MRMPAWVLWIAGFGCLAPFAPSASVAAADDLSLSAEEESAFYRWWDEHGFPDVTKSAFVKAATANWIQYGERSKKTPIYEYAFLLSDAGPTFVLFTTDLQVRFLRKTPAGTPEPDRIGYDPEDLLAFVRAGVETMRGHAGPVEWHEDESLDPFRAHRWLVPNQAFRLLILARACVARGSTDLATSLCSLALREAGNGTRSDASRVPARILEQLEADIAEEARAAVDLRFGDAEVPLEEVRNDLRRLAKAFPTDASFADDVKTIDRMLEEAAKRAKVPADPVGAVSDAEIESLVYRLRERTGTHRMNGDAFETEKGAPPSPMQRLVSLGFAACPRLVAALSDLSFTRSLLAYDSGHGQFREYVRPYRVRDAAIDVLDRIAGGTFTGDSRWNLHPMKADAWNAPVERATRWWQAASSKGEEAILIEAVRAGGRSAIAPAHRLAASYPKTAIPAIRAAIAATDEEWALGQIVRALDDVAGEEATDELLIVLREDKHLRARVTAAEALLRRGRQEGVIAMVKEWESPSPRAMDPRANLPADPMIGGDLLSLLVSSGSAEAYRALGKDLGRQPVERRFWILSAFLRGGPSSTVLTGPQAALGRGSGRPPTNLNPEARQALEDLLGERLGDDSGAEDVWMSIAGAGVDTRLGHVAARALAQLFPETYRYDPKASPEVRESQRLAAENAWHKKRGLPPVAPAPPRSKPEVIPAAIVGPAVDRFLRAAKGTEREAAGAAIEAMGIGSLPPVMDRLKGLAKDAPSHADLERIARALASIATDVVLSKESAPADDTFTALLNGLRGRSFDHDAFVRVVLGVTKGAPNGAAGLRLRALRGGDLSGVLVVVTLVKDPVQGWGGNPQGWSQWSHSGPHVRIGDERRGSKSGGMAIEYGQEEGGWAEDAREVEDALRSPPEVPVVLSFAVIREV